MANMPSEVLVLGGTGFIGKNLVLHLLRNEGIKIRVADKCPPSLQFFSSEYKAAFDNDRVDFVQADLTRSGGIDKAWRREVGGRWDVVVNLAAETGGGRDEKLYERRCADLSRMNAQRAGEDEPGLYIEMSTAFIYGSSSRVANDEDAELKPITMQAKYKLEGEEAVRGMEELNWCVFRPAIVYGKGDRYGIMPRAVCAATYVGKGERMDFLWDAGIKMATVSVEDVCRALCFAMENQEKFIRKVYNLADCGDTTQGKINGLLGDIFDINVGFVGKIVSNVARIHMDGVVEMANEKHLRPWADLCNEHGINTVLSPYISKELLENKHVNVDGGRVVKETGFTYEGAGVTRGDIEECLEEAVSAGLFMRIWGGTEKEEVEEEKEGGKET